MDALYDALETYLEGKTALSDQDDLILHCAGHGRITDSDKPVPKPQFATIEARADSNQGWLEYEALLTFMRQIRARHIFLISDACFSGALFQNAPQRFPSQTSYLELQNKPSRYILTSGGFEPVDDASFPNKGEAARQSVFNWALCESLSQYEGAYS